MAQDADFGLLDVEQKLLEAVDRAWAAYEQQCEQSMGAPLAPPRALVDLLFKAHTAIGSRMRSKLGVGFDPNNPERTLLQIERIKQMLIKQIEQRAMLDTAN